MGGFYNLLWQICVVYVQLVYNEYVVYSFVWGVVWVIYCFGLDVVELDKLKVLFVGQFVVLFSLYFNLFVFVVMMVWNCQFSVQIVDDFCLICFFKEILFENSVLEKGSLCVRGFGGICQFVQF